MNDRSIQQKLLRRHKEQGIRLYFERRRYSELSKEIQEWLSKHSVPRDRVLKLYVPVKTAGAMLGIRGETVLGLVRGGKLRFPLYDYSHYGSVDHYWVWVPKVEVIRYARSRRAGGRKRST